MAETPTDADHTAAIRPKVSLPELALAVVSLKVVRTMPSAEVGTIRARYSSSRA